DHLVVLGAGDTPRCASWRIGGGGVEGPGQHPLHLVAIEHSARRASEFAFALHDDLASVLSRGPQAVTAAAVPARASGAPAAPPRARSRLATIALTTEA